MPVPISVGLGSFEVFVDVWEARRQPQERHNVTARRFPPPWDIEEANASCFIVKDNNGQALAYVHLE